MLHCNAELILHISSETNQLQNLKPLTSQLRLHKSYEFHRSPQAFLSMIFRMLLLLRWNAFRSRSLGKKIKSKAMSGCRGFYGRTTPSLYLFMAMLLAINPIRSGLFSRSPGPREKGGGGGGGSEARMPKIKVNINWLKLKLCMGHYIYKSILDAKFEIDSSFSFGDMDVTKFS